MLRRTTVLFVCSLALVGLAACGGDDGDDGVLGSCPSDSTALEMMGALVIGQNCLSCHSSTSTDRMLAPPGVDFDKIEVVRSTAEEMYRRATNVNRPMPPTGLLNSSQTEAMRVYLACGANTTPTASLVDDHPPE